MAKLKSIFYSSVLSPGKLAWASSHSLYVPGVHKLGICELGSGSATLALYQKPSQLSTGFAVESVNAGALGIRMIKSEFKALICFSLYVFPMNFLFMAF